MRFNAYLELQSRVHFYLQEIYKTYMVHTHTCINVTDLLHSGNIHLPVLIKGCFHDFFQISPQLRVECWKIKSKA